jgi:metallo-beta-lactamase family protein
LNYGKFPFDPAGIDAALITHAHVDHSGLLPKLTRQGYRRRILATFGTRDLLSYVLPDAAQIQEADVERLNRRNAKRGRPEIEPIYRRHDAEACLRQIDGHDYDRWIAVMPGLSARFWNAGHILGSASIELRVDDNGTRRRLLFSGDLGAGARPLKDDPEGPRGFDYLVMESTYGDRDRVDFSQGHRIGVLRREIKEALGRGGNVLIPSFAIERTQELLFDLGQLFDAREIPPAQVYLDSPLASAATEIFRHHAEELPGVAHPETLFRRANFHFTETIEQSKAIGRIAGGAIIMAGSGMCDGGRIRHHLKANLWRPNATVLLVGYQAPGTLGQILLGGAPSVRIHGEEVAVKARIKSIDVYSGHADRSQLLEWLRQRLPADKAKSGQIFLTHGEPASIAGLRQGLIDLGIDAQALFVPTLDQGFRLEAGAPPAPIAGPARLLPEAVNRPDWHNAYAALLLDLPRLLAALPSDKARARMLAELRQQLGQNGKGQ